MIDLVMTPTAIERAFSYRDRDGVIHKQFNSATIRRKCVAGTMRYASKIDGKWYINVTKQWPELGLVREEV